MTPRSGLELEGNFLTHHFAQLLREISGARLYGSLRVSEGDRKCIFYFKGGNVVFAVSNSRSARLFDMLLRRRRLSQDDLKQIPNFSNDIDLTAFLQERGFITKAESDRMFTEQIEGIVIDVLSWSHGQWVFSSLARIRDGLGFPVDARRLLTDYSRCLTRDSVLGQFRTLRETLCRTELALGAVNLSPSEAFILSRFDDDASIAISDLVSIAGMNESDTVHAVFTLWISGYLDRVDWQPAFGVESIDAMQHAKLELRREAVQPMPMPKAPQAGDDPASPAADPQAEAPIEDRPITLDEYLHRVEAAETYYDVLGVDTRSEYDSIKRAYFGLAKVFHPDRFYAEGGETLDRVQAAFTELAQAHETLRNVETREIYDYRMRKEIAAREKIRAAGETGQTSLQIEQAAESFESGFSLLMDNRIEGALPLLARAVHYAPGNAKYRAYYGKALSGEEKTRHKAEAEMQAAVKLDPQNPTYRLMLAEFFFDYRLIKRAEGELNRLLAIFPSNREAKDLLARLGGKGAET